MEWRYLEGAVLISMVVLFRGLDLRMGFCSRCILVLPFIWYLAA